jgi:hypothetical protein
MTAQLRKQSLAEDAARVILLAEGWACICVYGSVARGSANASSDVDLVVVGKRRRNGRALDRLVNARLPGEGVSIRYFNLAGARRTFLSQPNSFTQHVLRESRILVDQDHFLEQLFDRARTLPWDSTKEMLSVRRRLRTLEPLDQYNGQYLFFFGRLYSIAKSIVILRLLEEGQPEFDRGRAFDVYARVDPARAPDVELLRRLEPFAHVSRANDLENLPFPPSGSHAEAAKSFRAAQSLAR